MPAGNVGQEVVDMLWGCVDFTIVDSKEEGYKLESSPLVPVDKWVADNEIVEKVCGLLHDCLVGFQLSANIL